VARPTHHVAPTPGGSLTRRRFASYPHLTLLRRPGLKTHSGDGNHKNFRRSASPRPATINVTGNASQKLMARKSNPENERVVSSDAAASRPRRQATASRAKRPPAPAGTKVPPAADVHQEAQPASDSGAAAPKPRRKTPATRTRRSGAKAVTPVSPATNRAAHSNQDTAVRLLVPAAAAEPSREAIAELAYVYWQARGGPDGSAEASTVSLLVLEDFFAMIGRSEGTRDGSSGLHRTPPLVSHARAALQRLSRRRTSGQPPRS